MHYLIAADADWVIDEVKAALEGPDVTIRVCHTGKAVTPAVADQPPDLVVLDMQIGTMGAIAVAMDLHLEESGGRLPHVPILILLDRKADVFLARRASAEGWLIKPLDSLRLRRAAAAVISGETYTEGLPEPIEVEELVIEDDAVDEVEPVEAAGSAAGEQAVSG